MPEKKEAKLLAVGELFTVNEIMAALKLYKESQVGFVSASKS